MCVSKSYISNVFLCALVFSFTTAHAADHFIGANVSTIDNANGAIREGDTITLAAGTRGPLTIKNLVGTATNPIKIRNDSNGSVPTVIRRTSGTAASGFIFILDNLKHVVIDGTGKWSGAGAGTCNANAKCGIKVTVAVDAAPTAFIKIGGSSKNFTIKGVEVDGQKGGIVTSTGFGIGISVNEHSYNVKSGYTQLNSPEWRENILVTDNYVHAIGSECMYIGPNYNTNGHDDIPLRNIEVSYNRINGCERDGINVKSTIQGNNKIHHNYITEIGIGAGGDAPDRQGIGVFEGSADIYANRVENVYRIYNGVVYDGGSCYQINMSNRPNTYGTFYPKVYNNICYNAEKHGIGIFRRDSGSAKLEPTVTHTTPLLILMKMELVSVLKLLAA